MASTDKIFVSPGVFTSEKDLTFVTRQVGVTTLGLVGETPKGPAFEPVFISDYDEFQRFFGGLNPKKFKGTNLPKYELNYIAKSYLSQSNQLYVSRVLGLSGYRGSDAWSFTINANVNLATQVLTTASTPSILFLSYTASTAGTPTTMVFTNSIAQGLYNNNITTSLFNSIGNKLIGETLTQSTVAYYKTGGIFLGAIFDTTVTARGIVGSIVTGTTSGNLTSYSASSYTEVENMVIATLRSRGSYNDTTQILNFNVSGSTGVVMAPTPTTYQTDPLGNLSISGTNINSQSFSYSLSFDSTKKNFITSVLGSSVDDKDAELFVEELYKNMLDDLNAEGKVLGINSTLKHISNLKEFRQEYQSAQSPYLLSELRGNKVYRLFRIITISDGDAANRDIKISIINIKPDEKTFDLIVRKFDDTDDRPFIIEKYSNLSMLESDNGFIGRKIGTTDGEYVLKSKYIMVEMADNYPNDAVPAGFEGVPVKTYIDSSTNKLISPDISYKKEYLETDKVRKVYLGISDTIGVDQDFFNNKGLTSSGGEFTGRTDGFHLDVNATGATIDGISYVPTFETGISAFTTNASLLNGPYEKLAARKFTFAPFGGFDGWDIYRNSRTNGDKYTKTGTYGFIGNTNGVFESRPTSEGDDAINSDYYAFLEGVYTFKNPEAVNINIFATPGIDLRDNTSLINEVISVVEDDRADSLYLVTLPDTDGDGVTAISEDEAVGILEDTGIDSNYSATYWPWLQMRDTENNQYIWLPPTLEVVRNIALTDNISFPWFATAGLSRGTTTAIKARKKLTLEQRDNLYEGRINPMATFSETGVVIWGNKTLQVKETALNRINVRRLLLQARKLISAVAIRLLFEQNDDVVRSQFLNLVNPILDSIRKERGLTDFRVVLSNDPEEIDRNELNGKVFIKPTRTLEFIAVEFVVTNTGASFDNL